MSLDTNLDEPAHTPTAAAASPQSPARADTDGAPPVPLSLRLLRAGFRSLGPVLPRAMGGIAYRLWFRTTPRRVRPDEAPVIARAEQGSLTFGGRPLATYRWGAGDPVLLMHGWNGRAAQMARFVDPLLDAGYGVVAIDAPGHGRTPGRRTDAFELRDALRTVAAEHGPFRGVVAHSIGALATALAAAESALPVERVVCLAPAVTLDPMVARFTTMVGLPPRVQAELRRRVEAFVGPDFWARPMIDAPTLIVHDRADATIPFAEGAALVDRWPRATLTATEGLGHGGILRDPAVIARAVAFLAGQSPADAKASV